MSNIKWKAKANQDAENALKEAEKASKVKLKKTLLTTAKKAEGKSVAAHSTLELKTLLAALLYKEGALNEDLTVRPLADWLKD